MVVVRRFIAQFFSEAKRDHLLVLYFSGHGIKDEQGNLYLAVRDSERTRWLEPPSKRMFITAQMDRSFAR